MIDEILDEVLDVRRAIAMSFLERDVFLAVLQCCITDGPAEDNSFDILLRLGDSIEDLQCRRVTDARAAKLIQAINENEKLAIIKRMFETFPKGGFNLAGGAARLCVLDSIIDVGQQVLATDPAIE